MTYWVIGVAVLLLMARVAAGVTSYIRVDPFAGTLHHIRFGVGGVGRGGCAGAGLHSPRAVGSLMSLEIIHRTRQR